jgi:2-desacetyl-2-hydroxyethyl bacteriochlorophyllide A dehydrogenase
MTDTNARAFWITEPGRSELRSAVVADPGPEEVKIETLYSAVSRGTESLVYSGRVPPSEYERMRAPFQEGDFPGPVKYGYINVGRVTHGREDLIGQTVFCLYPHQTHFVVPADAVTVIPDGVPASRAVLAAYLQTAVNGIWDGAPRTGDRIAVVGAGTVGSLIAWLARSQTGTEVELIDIDAGKAATAEALGVGFNEPDSAARDVDLVFEASGTADGLRLALELAGFEAKIVVMSWFGTRPVEVPLGGAFHSKRLRLVSSQVSHIAESQRSRWDFARRSGLVMRLLEHDELDALITGECRFEELPELFRDLARDNGGVLCHRIAYR